MIDLHIDRGHLRRCYVNGDLSTIAGEFGVAISSIYGQLLKRSSADGAAQFKFLIQLTACDDSPVWDDMLGDLERLCGIPATTLHGMCERQKYPVDLWRQVAAALDKLEGGSEDGKSGE